MQSLGNPSTSKKNKQAQADPFARALAETEQSAYAGDKKNDLSNPLADAMARTGGAGVSTDADNLSNKTDPEALAKQQQEALKAQEKKALHKKLHDRVNPVNEQAVFNAKEKRVKEEINKVRRELQMFVQEVKSFAREVDLELQKEVVQPGRDGTGYFNYFHKLRVFIMLLTQKVKSARTWAKQMHAKSSKKPKRGSAGMRVSGKSHEKTTTVHQMMHHEQSTVYSGG